LLREGGRKKRGGSPPEGMEGERPRFEHRSIPEEKGSTIGRKKKNTEKRPS